MLYNTQHEHLTGDKPPSRCETGFNIFATESKRLNPPAENQDLIIETRKRSIAPLTVLCIV